MADRHSILGTAQYIFQIPISWFRKVDAWLSNVHPGHMVDFGDDPDNNPTIGIDPTVFEQEVSAIVDQKAGAPTAPESQTNMTSGYVGNSNAHSLLPADAWTAGGTAGLRVFIATRGTDDGTDGAVVFRPCIITPDGRIYQVGNETNLLGVTTEQD